MKQECRKIAFVKSLPILCSYVFVSMAYGIMMEESGTKETVRQKSGYRREKSSMGKMNVYIAGGTLKNLSCKKENKVLS